MTKEEMIQALDVAIEYIEEMLGSDADDSETLVYLQQVAAQAKE